MILNKTAKQAENEQGADDGEEMVVLKKKRKEVSKRSFLNVDSSEAESIDAATGARYELLAPSGNIVLDYKFGDDSDFDRKCALFGYHTKIGNVANTVLNDKDEPGSPQDAAAAIREFIQKAQGADGVWADKTGGVGARVDKDALADSIHAVGTAAGKAVKPVAEIRARLESDQAYLRMARQVPEVAAEYATRVGKVAKTVDDLFA
jgi:hypothetical protein